MIVPGTLSRSLGLGHTIREAREQGHEPAAAAAAFAGGRVLFRGQVTKREWQNACGNQVGDTYITGAGTDQDHTLRIWFKNEHHFSWLDVQPYVTTPELLAVMQAGTAEPIVNICMQEGDLVAGGGYAGSSHVPHTKGGCGAWP